MVATTCCAYVCDRLHCTYRDTFVHTLLLACRMFIVLVHMCMSEAKAMIFNEYRLSGILLLFLQVHML